MLKYVVSKELSMNTDLCRIQGEILEIFSVILKFMIITWELICLSLSLGHCVCVGLYVTLGICVPDVLCEGMYCTMWNGDWQTDVCRFDVCVRVWWMSESVQQSFSGLVRTSFWRTQCDQKLMQSEREEGYMIFILTLSVSVCRCLEFFWCCVHDVVCVRYVFLFSVSSIWSHISRDVASEILNRCQWRTRSDT